MTCVRSNNRPNPPHVAPPRDTGTRWRAPPGQRCDAFFSGRARALRCVGKDAEPAGSRPAANNLRNRGKKCFTALPVVVALLSLLCCTAGCRAIHGIGESRQSIAARKLSRQGLQKMRVGKWTDAEQLFGEALALSDKDDRAHRGLAETYWNRGQRVSAIEHMEKAVALSAGDPRLVGRLGEMYLQEGQLEKAVTQSEIALASERNSAEIWTLRGDCLRQKGNEEEALAAYHRALALQPDYVEAKLHVAELYLNSNQYDRILATLDQLDPVGDESAAPTRVHMLRGIAMRNLDRPELAAKHFAKAAESDPLRAEPHLQLAAIELEKGRPDLASRSVARALQLDRQLVESSGWKSYLLSPEQLAAQQADDETRR
ncbi:cellulose synthase subunit BcsC [Stieleria magnilauensis]|uniref:Cellulose synthase subunit BcsC n=1 Tax=Stieleria magnilauensis TaxID=2527963 RepID=A0ABX5Y1S0_9BACT|nr:cellulose synthase subunit BcsC [Planctomycetes bacterium TBK1r]